MKRGLFFCLAVLLLIPILAGCGGGGGGNDLTPKSWAVSQFSDYVGPGWGMAFDSSDNLYVADFSNHRIIKITTVGTSSIWVDDRSIGTYLGTPRGIAVDASDNLYVCNDGYHDIIKITPGPICSLYAGTKGVSGSSNTSPVTFNRPFGLALNRTSQLLYLADRDNGKIRKIDMSGGMTVSDFANLTAPNAVAVDSAGYVYACAGDKIYKYTAAGGYDNGYTLWANPVTPVLYGIAVDGSGNMLAADWANHIIWKIDSDGHASVLAGTPGTPGSTNGPASSALFNHPYGIAIDSQGRIYVTEETGGIRRIVYQ